MKKSFYILLLFSLIIQSCVVYQKTSVSLDDAVNKGKVKVIDNYGADEFDFIELTDLKYYGVIKKGRITDRTPIDTVGVLTIYLQDIKKSKRKSIALGLGVGLGIPAAFVLFILILMLTSFAG